MKKRHLLSIVICLFSISCVSTSHMGLVSTRNIDYSANYSIGGETMHSATVMFILLVPVMVQDANMVEIIDVAMKKEGYDFMTDVTVSQSFIFTYVFNSFTYKVTGTGWRNTEMTSSVQEQKEIAKYAVSEIDGKLSVEKIN